MRMRDQPAVCEESYDTTRQNTIRQDDMMRCGHSAVPARFTALVNDLRVQEAQELIIISDDLDL